MTHPEQFRLTREGARKRGISELFGSDESYGANGMFFIPFAKVTLRVIASDGTGAESPDEAWEHVSVTLPNRCPTWEEMCFVKHLFWPRDQACVQFHPAEADYVNNHPFCLHLWRPVNGEMRMPPAILVGLKGAQIFAK